MCVPGFPQFLALEKAIGRPLMETPEGFSGRSGARPFRSPASVGVVRAANHARASPGKGMTPDAA